MELVDKILKRVIVCIGMAIRFIAPIKINAVFLKSSFAGYKTTYKREPNCSTQVKEQVGYLTNDLVPEAEHRSSHSK